MHSASETLAQIPFTIRKDRPENALRSDSSGLESFLIVNVPAKEAQYGWKCDFYYLTNRKCNLLCINFFIPFG
jgi:hypothetical protein